MRYTEIIKQLEALADPEAVQGMARYGITAGSVYGVKIPELRKLAREIGTDHSIARTLWEKDNRETRILAGMIADPKIFTVDEAERWVLDFDSWEVCDQCCMNLLEKTDFAYTKALEWSSREEEFVKRAGFVLMARLAVSDKAAPAERFIEFFPHIEREASDPRNFVKKAVNWALRQIGKRNLKLNHDAVELAECILGKPERSARWIASDALRELRSHAVQTRLISREGKRV